LDFDFAAYSVKVIIVEEKEEDRDRKRIYAFVLISLAYSSIYIDELINLTISQKRKKIFERLKMDFEGKE